MRDPGSEGARYRYLLFSVHALRRALNVLCHARAERRREQFCVTSYCTDRNEEGKEFRNVGRARFSGSQLDIAQNDNSGKLRRLANML